MMTRIAALAALVLALGSTQGALAQSEPSATAAPSPAPPPAARREAPADTLVAIEIAQPISTRTVKQGDMFAIRLSEPIKVDGVVIVPAGITGQGQVVDAGKAGMMGKPAKLVLAVRYLDWNGGRIPLHGFRWAEKTGQDRTDTVMAASFVPYAGVLSIFIHGGEIDVPEGAQGMAKLGAPVSASTDQPAAQ